MKRKNTAHILILISLLLAALMCAGCKNSGDYYASADGIHMELTDDMQWYKYDPDNLFGISATVYDDLSITYVFEKDKCLFGAEDVKNAFAGGELFGCKAPGIFKYEPENVIYETVDDRVQLTLFYDEEEMEKVDGFWFYFSGDEYIRCGFTKSTMYIDHIEITEKRKDKYDGEEYDSYFGDDWTQSWNLEDSGKWSEVRNRHYSSSNMPLE